MSLAELFDVLRAYQGSTLTLWNLYIGIVLGLLGYALGSKQPLTWPIRLLLILGFCIFVSGNLRFLERNQELIYALSAEIKEVAAEKPPISTTLRETLSTLPSRQSESILGLHIAADMVVVALLLVGPSLAAKFRLWSARRKG